MLPIDLQIKDLERIEKAFSTVAKVSNTVAFVSIVIWVWVRAPGLNFNLPVGGGSVSNVNVGYAVVFGPLIVWFLLMWQFIARKKVLLLIGVIDYNNKHCDLRQLDSLFLLISNYSNYEKPFFLDLYWIGNRFLKNILYFLIPGIVSLVCFIRLIDFIPMEYNGQKSVEWVSEETSGKYRYNCTQKDNDNNPCTWTKSQHIRYWLLSVPWSGVQPTLMDKNVETDKNKGGSFPYIYPYVVWLNIFLIFFCAWISFCCFSLSREPLKIHNNAINADA